MNIKKDGRKSVTIAFHTSQIDLRGTCVALYDYALHNETLLENKSYIITPINRKENNMSVYRKMKDRFVVLEYSDMNNMEKLLDKNNVDIFYDIKYGHIGPLPKGIKTAIHCVFDMSQPHGDVYVGVSKNLSKIYKLDEDYVPHMIYVSDNMDDMRKELNIPEDAIVLGRHGGMDTFDIGFVKEAIREIVKEEDNIYFVFMNTPKFMDHERIIHLEGTSILSEKRRFVNSCDGLCHGQFLGETFGLTVGENNVSSRISNRGMINEGLVTGKPIISFIGAQWHKCHLDILGNSVLGYHNKEDIKKRFREFLNGDYKPGGKYGHVNWDKYSINYSPEKVMEQFKKIIIDPLSK
jgi:hypothetical protein